MVNRIDFTNDSFLESYILNEKPISSLNPISKINLLVGANNSGKSRFMRFLLKKINNYEGPDLSKFTTGSIRYQSIGEISFVRMSKRELNEIANDITTKISSYVNRLRWTEFQNLIDSQEHFSEYDLIRIASTFEDTINTLNTVDKLEAQRNKNNIVALRNIFHKNIYDFISSVDKQKYLVTYLPSFRTLRKFTEPIQQEQANPYSSIKYAGFKRITEPIVQWRNLIDYFQVINKKDPNDFFSNNEVSYTHTFDFEKIFSGETLYDMIAELRNSGEAKRLLLTGFEDFLSKHFFNGARIQLNSLNHEGVEDVFVKIGDEKEFPIYNLGDGIQSIILLTFPLFYNRNVPKHFIFYEEPELYLHPGMQRIFIEVLKSFSNVQAFIVTHSNHILETSLDFKDDISIFSFEKVLKEGFPTFNVEMLSSPNISILNMLGVRNSSIFLSNCCLWVEGISDRIYIKKFLELYFSQKENLKIPQYFFEDLHFSFLEFGGNQIVHYDFSEENKTELKIQARKITNRILLIHDQDTNKAKRHALLKKELADNYIQLPVLEIENILTPNVLRQTLNSYRKNEMVELTFNEFSHEDYAKVPIGMHIHSCILSGKIKQIVSRSTKNTTPKILNKADFALKAVGNLNEWDDLGEMAQKLTIKIYEFIASHNTSHRINY